MIGRAPAEKLVDWAGAGVHLIYNSISNVGARPAGDVAQDWVEPN
jgi:hypothetical protein